MPKAETSNSNGGPSFLAPRYRPNWLAAASCFVLGPSLTVALLDYDPAQVTLNTTHATATNIVGTVGANTVWCSLYTVGVSTWLVPVFLFWMLYVSIRNSRRLTGTRMLSMLICIIALAGLGAMVESIKPSDYFPEGSGGLVGRLVDVGVRAPASQARDFCRRPWVPGLIHRARNGHALSSWPALAVRTAGSGSRTPSSRRRPRRWQRSGPRLDAGDTGVQIDSGSLRGAVVLVVAKDQLDPALFQLGALARIQQRVQFLGRGRSDPTRSRGVALEASGQPPAVLSPLNDPSQGRQQEQRDHDRERHPGARQ